MDEHEFQPGDIVTYREGEKAGIERVVAQYPKSRQPDPKICWMETEDEPRCTAVSRLVLVRRAKGQRIKKGGICPDCHGKEEILLLTFTVPCKCVEG